MNLFRRLFSDRSVKSTFNEIDASEAHQRLNQASKPFLLDVRQPDEYREAHIESAYLIPLGELSFRLGELPRDQEIIVVCHSGSRSILATRHLISAGYEAINLTGGLISWYRKGLPLEKGSRQS